MDDVRFYGYKHFTLEDPPRCFYVGKGRKNRPHSTIRGHKWHAIVKRYGLRVEICIGPVTNDEALKWEASAIVEMGTFTINHSHDDSTDIGCNFTRGGEGPAGYHFTEQQRRHHKAVQNTAETLERKRFAQLAVSVQKSAAIKATHATPEVKAKKSAATSRRNTLNWQDPVYRQKMETVLKSDKFLKAHAAAMARPEVRAIRSENSKRMWADPAHRILMQKPVKCGVCGETGHNRRRHKPT